MMIAAIAAALVSCQSKGTQNNDSAVGEGVLTVAGNDSSAVAVYEGLLPAADGPGIQYVLSVDSGKWLYFGYDLSGCGRSRKE